MARRLIMDTGVLIAAERGRIRLDVVIAPDDDVAIAAVTVAELTTGVALASELHPPVRARFVADVLARLPVESYDVATAQAHGLLLAHVHSVGEKRGAHDLIVAATAAATGRTVLTTDRQARFDALPGVSCVVVQ